MHVVHVVHALRTYVVYCTAALKINTKVQIVQYCTRYTYTYGTFESTFVSYNIIHDVKNKLSYAYMTHTCLFSINNYEVARVLHCTVHVLYCTYVKVVNKVKLLFISGEKQQWASYELARATVHLLRY